MSRNTRTRSILGSSKKLANVLCWPRAKKKRSIWTVSGSLGHDCAPMAITRSRTAARVFSRSVFGSGSSNIKDSGLHPRKRKPLVCCKRQQMCRHDRRMGTQLTTVWKVRMNRRFSSSSQRSSEKFKGSWWASVSSMSSLLKLWENCEGPIC